MTGRYGGSSVSERGCCHFITDLGEERGPQQNVWSFVLVVGLECCGGGPAAEVSHVLKQRAALALVSFWGVPSLQQKQIIRRLTKR